MSKDRKSELEWLTDPAGYWSVQDLPGTGWQILGIVGIIVSFITLLYMCSEIPGYAGPDNPYVHTTSTYNQGERAIAYFIVIGVFVLSLSVSLGFIAVGSIIHAIYVCAERLIPRSPCHVCHKPFPTADLHRLDSGQLICPECRSEMKT